MRTHIPTETEQRQSEWTADDFLGLLSLGCNSSILFKGNFLMTTQYILKFYEYISFWLLDIQLNSPKTQG